jgi:3-oxoacyl-[acyl-carrier-protein] synthase III
MSMLRTRSVLTTSTSVCARPLTRLGIRADVLKDIAGIHSRRMWDDDTLASDAATMAAEKALAEVGVDRARIGLLVNTSVSRDFLEPSTASIVSGNLGLSEICQNFDVANACLAFLNGMDIASRMIERGEIDYALRRGRRDGQPGLRKDPAAHVVARHHRRRFPK